MGHVGVLRLEREGPRPSWCRTPTRGKARELAQRTHETAMLMAPTGGQAICLEYIESPRPIRLSFERGRVMPLYAGAASKILLAFLDDRERKRTLAAAEGAVLENGRVISSAELSAELTEIEKAGYCVSEGEVNVDTVGVAAPVFRRRRLVAGLTLAGPSRRFTDEYPSQMSRRRRRAAGPSGSPPAPSKASDVTGRGRTK